MSHPEPNDPYGQRAQPPTPAPGLMLGKIGMILALIPCISTIGLIICVVALVQSNNASTENKFAKIGVVAGVVWLVVGFIVNGTLG